MVLPLVTVIIPTYNRRSIVVDAINSIFNQTYKNIEVVVVDDGSTDGTGDLIKEVFSHKVKYIYTDHGEKARARNLGAKSAKGEFICFLDSDDLLTEDSIEKRVNCFFERKRCDVAYGIAIREKDNKEYRYPPLKGYPEGNILVSYVQKPFISTNDYMIRKDEFLRHGLYREDLTNQEDFELMIRLAKRYYFSFCGTYTSIVRRKGSSARSNYSKIVSQGTKVLDYIFSDDPPKELLRLKKKLYGENYLLLAEANRRMGKVNEFRDYFRKAREVDSANKYNLKFWRRWLYCYLSNLSL